MFNRDDTATEFGEVVFPHPLPENASFQIELPAETEVAGVRLDAGKSANDFPRGYKVELSADGTTWGKPVAEGKGGGTITDIPFAPAKAKFIRITQTGAVQGKFWSIHELSVLKSGGKL